MGAVIPVLICPIINRPDLLARMIGAIDTPVDRLVVVDMTDDGCTVHPDQLTIRPLISLGYPGAINAGILQTPDAPWWLFASNDIVFGPGDLDWIAVRMESTEGPCFITGDRNDDRLLRNAYGAVNVQAIEAIGLVDEHAFYPIYFDDDDWERRCRLGGVEWVEYNGAIHHDRSSTINSDARAMAGNTRTFAENRRRYMEKWGGAPGSERFTTPYDLGVPLSFTRPDPAGRAARAW